MVFKLPISDNGYTFEQVRSACKSIKKFSENLEKQMDGDFAEEAECCMNLLRWADKLESLLP